MKTYDIQEAADFLEVDRSTALVLANDGTLPGGKVGRAWVFMEDQRVNHLRDITRKQTHERKAYAQAGADLRLAQQQRDVRGRRSRGCSLPVLPELTGEVAAAKV
jgi:hypothetical protein